MTCPSVIVPKSLYIRFQEAEPNTRIEIIRAEKLPRILVDEIIKSANEDLISEILEFQEIDDDQLIQILMLNSTDLNEWVLELKDIPQSIIDRAMEDESLKSVKDFIVTYIPLPQSTLRELIEIGMEDWDLHSLIENQALNESNIRYILSNIKWDLGISLIEHILRYQPLPPSLLEELFEKGEIVRELIEYQPFPDELIIRIFEDERYQEYYYDLARYQTFSDTVIDFVKNWERKSFLYTLARIQPLKYDDVVWLIETGFDSVISGVLESQNFTPSERERLREDYPQYAEYIGDRNHIFSTLNVLSNRRHFRDHALQQKLDLLQEEEQSLDRQ